MSTLVVTSEVVNRDIGEGEILAVVDTEHMDRGVEDSDPLDSRVCKPGLEELGLLLAILALSVPP